MSGSKNKEPKKRDVVKDRNIMPTLPEWERQLLASFVHSLKKSENHANELRMVSRRWQSYPSMAKFCAVALVLADLLDNGWRLKTRQDTLILVPFTHNPSAGETVQDAKLRLQKALRIGRDRQLEEASVQTFIQKLEQPTPGRMSVLTLIADGAELSRQLQDVDPAAQDNGLSAFTDVIRPEIEICETGKKCKLTGIRLLDIWRYFRHTWSLEYRPVPGRAMPILIRNAAHKNKPVMGIAMLASPVMKMKVRDEWLGYSMDRIEELAMTQPSLRLRLLRDLKTALDTSIDAIRHDDLLTNKELQSPSQDIIFRLERLAAGAAAVRETALRNRRDTDGGASRGDVNSKNIEDVDWKLASEDPLFVKKRAETLAVLLAARHELKTVQTSKDFLDALVNKSARRALMIALRERLKDGVSSQIMDVSVCGAVPPFNDLLVGKLVTLLMASKEIGKAYSDRYGGRPSIIASQMAGRPIVKKAQLRMLTTTSLYGHSSSQYNRLKLWQKDYPHLKDDILWTRIKQTKGFGSIHLSNDTVAALRTISADEHGMRRINSRFGEGTNPRMRQIREGLESLGIPSDDVLQHSTKRILYGCRLDGEAGPLPFAFSKRRLQTSSALDIANAWALRWAIPRLSRPGILERVEGQGPQTVHDLLWRNQDGQLRLKLAGH